MERGPVGKKRPVVDASTCCSAISKAQSSPPMSRPGRLHPREPLPSGADRESEEAFSGEVANLDQAERGTEFAAALRWREQDSNHRFRGKGPTLRVLVLFR